MPSKVVRDICPKCNTNTKNARSFMCVTCSREQFKYYPLRRESHRPKGTIPTGDQVDLIRPPDDTYGKPSVRPPHFPPPCEACNGFGYHITHDGPTTCDTCIDHPGHAMSFTDWAAIRP